MIGLHRRRTDTRNVAANSAPQMRIGLRSLRRAWPDARIDVVVPAAARGLLAGNPDCNGILAYPAERGIAAWEKATAATHFR